MTEQAKRAAQLIKRGKTKKQAMLDAGYAPSTACNPKVLTDSNAFRAFMASINEKPLINRLVKWAESDDKDISFLAIKEILKLKDRYPANKLKVTQYEEELDHF